MTATIDSDRVTRVLAREHAAARAQRDARRQAGPGTLLDRSEAYLAIGPDQGATLYMLARAAGARRIVEFGSSFGISTLYLAAAAADSEGHVTGSERYDNKRTHALASLEEAGLACYAEIRAGDALESLTGVEGPLDFVFLDGEKSAYREVLDALTPRLRTGAWVIADNLDHFEGEPGDFRHFITHSPERFTTRLIAVGPGLFSVSRFRG